MNEIQEQFYNFFIEKVIEEKKEEAIKLLETTFEKQNKGEFNFQYFKETEPKYMALVKSEYMDEVTKLMEQYGANLQNNNS